MTENAVFGVELLQHLQQVLALLAIIGGHFTNKHGGHHRILVPDIGARQIAVALLKPKDIPLRMPRFFQQADLLADIFETGENLHHTAAVFLPDAGGQVGGDDGFHHHRLLRQIPFGGAAGQNIVKQQAAHLVARHQGVVPPVPHGDAHPVAVGIGGQQQIRLLPFRQLERAAESLPDFGVGIRRGGEAAVRLLLLRHHSNGGNADAAQHLPDRLVPRTVEGGVNHLERRFGAHAGVHLPGEDITQEILHQRIGNQGDPAVGQRLVEIDGLNVLKQVHFTDTRGDLAGIVVGHLATVRAVALVAIVFCRVVAGRDHDARLTAQLPYRE